MTNKKEMKVIEKFKVEFFGDGESWEYRNLTYKEAAKKVDNCPKEYMAFMTPESIEVVEQ